jgi:hypothetical protein
MASKTGRLLTSKQRKELVDELQKYGELKEDIGSTPTPSMSDMMDIETKSGEVNKADGDQEDSSVQIGQDTETAIIVSSRQSSRKKDKGTTRNSIESGQVTGPVTSVEASISGAEDAEAFGTGCLFCGVDDDHANLLLCEGCNAEYHTYVIYCFCTDCGSGGRSLDCVPFQCLIFFFFVRDYCPAFEWTCVLFPYRIRYCLDPPLRAVPTGDWYCCKFVTTKYIYHLAETCRLQFLIALV